MTEAMPFLQKYDITFLRPPTITGGEILFCAWFYGYFSKISRMEAENAETPIPDGLILFSAST